LIGVEGRLDFSRWTDDGGVKHVKPLIHGVNLRLLGSKRDNAGGGPDMPESF
jgi:single-stranded DNA-binding protein